MANLEQREEDIWPPSSGVYSMTAKTLQEKKKQANYEVQRKLEMFLRHQQQKEARVSDKDDIDVASSCHEELGGSSKEKVAMLGSSFRRTDRSPSPPMDPIFNCSGTGTVTVKRNIYLSERMRKVEENRKARKEYIVNSALADGQDISRIDMDKLDATSPDQDDNWTLNVKVNHCGTILRYEMGMNDNFSTLNSWLESKTGVHGHTFSIIFNNRALKPNETPASIGLSITDILDFIPSVNPVQAVAIDEVHDDHTLIKVFLKTENFREKLEFHVHKDDKMAKLLQEYGTKFNRDISSLQLRFDGETIDLESTAAELDLEDDFQIDIIQKN